MFQPALRVRILLMALLVCLMSGARAPAWDEDGHATVTRLAIDAMPETMPAWLRSPAVRARLVYLAPEPDRWRGQDHRILNHVNGPEHYFDVEDLADFGLGLDTLPPLRRQFLDILATRRALQPEQFKPRNVKKDKAYTALVPGLLPYRIVEVQWKIAANWTELKTYLAHRDRVSDAMIQNARDNIVYYMGILGHYVGDGAQPLHLTRHHHGWQGENPKGYTTDHGFHSMIDSGVIRLHGIYYDTLKNRVRPARKIPRGAAWQETCRYLGESYRVVEPLYALEKSGKLKQTEGKQFIEDRLLAASSMLAGLWVAARDAAIMDDFRAERLMKEYPKELGMSPKKRAARVRTTGSVSHAARAR